MRRSSGDRQWYRPSLFKTAEKTSHASYTARDIVRDTRAIQFYSSGETRTPENADDIDYFYEGQMLATSTTAINKVQQVRFTNKHLDSAGNDNVQNNFTIDVTYNKTAFKYSNNEPWGEEAAEDLRAKLAEQYKDQADILIGTEVVDRRTVTPWYTAAVAGKDVSMTVTKYDTDEQVTKSALQNEGTITVLQGSHLINYYNDFMYFTNKNGLLLETDRFALDINTETGFPEGSQTKSLEGLSFRPTEFAEYSLGTNDGQHFTAENLRDKLMQLYRPKVATYERDAEGDYKLDDDGNKIELTYMTVTSGTSVTKTGSADGSKFITLAEAGNVYVGDSVTGTGITGTATVLWVDGSKVRINQIATTNTNANYTFTNNVAESRNFRATLTYDRTFELETGKIRAQTLTGEWTVKVFGKDVKVSGNGAQTNYSSLLEDMKEAIQNHVGVKSAVVTVKASDPIVFDIRFHHSQEILATRAVMTGAGVKYIPEFRSEYNMGQLPTGDSTIDSLDRTNILSVSQTDDRRSASWNTFGTRIPSIKEAADEVYAEYMSSVDRCLRLTAFTSDTDLKNGTTVTLKFTQRDEIYTNNENQPVHDADVGYETYELKAAILRDVVAGATADLDVKITSSTLPRPYLLDLHNKKPDHPKQQFTVNDGTDKFSYTNRFQTATFTEDDVTGEILKKEDLFNYYNGDKELRQTITLEDASDLAIGDGLIRGSETWYITSVNGNEISVVYSSSSVQMNPMNRT